ncbi:MAG: rRNA biogenesis protein rrp5 [Ruminiclostridium sp.]
MKLNLELNPIELRDAIINGTLLSLVEGINNNQSEIEADAKTLKDSELPKSTTEKADKANSEDKGKAEDPKPEDDSPTKEEITLEQVRAKLTALSHSGKQVQVKALITKFGASKLSDIPAEKYAEVLSEAEGLK